jgi:hypothetical protein
LKSEVCIVAFSIYIYLYEYTARTLLASTFFDKPLLVRFFHELTLCEALSHFGDCDHVFSSRSFDT